MRTLVVLVRDGREVARWPLELLAAPDVRVVDDLARLQLAARRVGMAVRLSAVPPDLARILKLAGLERVLRLT